MMDNRWIGKFSSAHDQKFTKARAARDRQTWRQFKGITGPGSSSTTVRRLRNTTKSL